MYGPSIIPISGAMTAVTLMDVPMAPIIGNRDQKEKMVHKGAKQQTEAMFLVVTVKLRIFIGFLSIIELQLVNIACYRYHS